MSSISASGGRHTGTVILAAILAIIGVLFAIAGIIYLTKTVATLPGFLPGKELTKTKSHHTLRGIGSLVVAVVLFVVAGISVARSRRAKA